MNKEEDTDQFQLLEQKIDSLIGLIIGLKKENDSFSQKYEMQEKRLADLTEELERMKVTRNKAKQRIVSLLEKIEGIDI